VDGFTIDFREGGREHGRFRFGNVPEIRNDSTYQDIVHVTTADVPGRRIGPHAAGCVTPLSVARHPPRPAAGTCGGTGELPFPTIAPFTLSQNVAPHRMRRR
jgi:hypothetical protein